MPTQRVSSAIHEIGLLLVFMHQDLYSCRLKSRFGAMLAHSLNRGCTAQGSGKNSWLKGISTFPEPCQFSWHWIPKWYRSTGQKLWALVNWSLLIFAKRSQATGTVISPGFVLCGNCWTPHSRLIIFSLQGYQAGTLGPKGSKISTFSRFVFHLIFPINAASLSSPSFPIPYSSSLPWLQAFAPLAYFKPYWCRISIRRRDNRLGKRAKEDISIFFTGTDAWKRGSFFLPLSKTGMKK